MREINKVIAQARVLYNRPTASREANFDQLIQALFDRYTELTNRAVSDQEKYDLEQLTVIADKEQVKQIERMEMELKELYEIAEYDRQSTFDSKVNKLWTSYSNLVDEDTVSSLREECDNLTLTANEIDRLMEMERAKERVEEIENELTDLFNRTTSSRPLDFDFKVDNLFMELSRIKDVPDTPEFRKPFENLTIRADEALLKQQEKRRKEIEQTKIDLRNQYLVLRRNRNERFAITEAYLVDKLTMFIGHEPANQFRQKCIDENEELENKDIADLGQEYIKIAGKSTFDRDMNDEDRRREIITMLKGRVPQSEVDEMIQEGLRIEDRVKQRERSAESRRQRSQMRATIDDESERKEEKKQQGNLRLPIPQAQRENGQERPTRPSIQMSVTFEEENGAEHTGPSRESSKSRTVTPIRQSGAEAIEIESDHAKEKSKTPEQQVNLQIGAESEPPTIPDHEQREHKKSESEPTIEIQNIN